MDRLDEIKVPTLVMAGRDDNPHDERTAEVMGAVRDFIPTDVGVPGDVAVAGE
jgi:hypothetical protein